MKINFSKGNGVIPAIIQDHVTNKVLMLGYMNRDALEKTLEEGKVTFYSRSKNRLWTKGETSGNYLGMENILIDCDQDTLLIKVNPYGPVCHTGQDTCFGEQNRETKDFLIQLENVIKDRKINPKRGSYTTKLFNSGIKKIAQKVGEEAAELLLESREEDLEDFKNEAADLIYHLLVLLTAKDVQFGDIVSILKRRHRLR